MKNNEKKPNNPIAFPRTAFDNKGDLTTYGSEFEGMTLRDYFANSVMQAHLSTDYGILHQSDSHNDAMLCARFYDFADAMLKAREL
jgi:hypothetical protein